MVVRAHVVAIFMFDNVHRKTSVKGLINLTFKALVAAVQSMLTYFV